LPQRFLASALLRLRVYPAFRRMPCELPSKVVSFPGRYLHEESRFLDCGIRACGCLHCTDIRRRCAEDEVRLREGPHEVGRLNQDLLIVQTRKGGGSPSVALSHLQRSVLFELTPTAGQTSRSTVMLFQARKSVASPSPPLTIIYAGRAPPDRAPCDSSVTGWRL